MQHRGNYNQLLQHTPRFGFLVIWIVWIFLAVSAKVYLLLRECYQHWFSASVITVSSVECAIQMSVLSVLGWSSRHCHQMYNFNGLGLQWDEEFLGRTQAMEPSTPSLIGPMLKRHSSSLWNIYTFVSTRHMHNGVRGALGTSARRPASLGPRWGDMSQPRTTGTSFHSPRVLALIETCQCSVSMKHF